MSFLAPIGQDDQGPHLPSEDFATVAAKRVSRSGGLSEGLTDSVNLTDLIRILKMRGASPQFVMLLEHLYEDAWTVWETADEAWQHNGVGLRQGDGLSCGLFLVVMDVVLYYLEAEMPPVKGPTGQLHFCAGGFADDLSAVFDEASIPIYLNCMVTLEVALGWKTHTTKSFFIPFGPNSSDTPWTLPDGRVWKPLPKGQSCKLLGAFFAGGTQKERQLTVDKQPWTMPTTPSPSSTPTYSRRNRGPKW